MRWSGPLVLLPCCAMQASQYNFNIAEESYKQHSEIFNMDGDS